MVDYEKIYIAYCYPHDRFDDVLSFKKDSALMQELAKVPDGVYLQIKKIKTPKGKASHYIEAAIKKEAATQPQEDKLPF